MDEDPGRRRRIAELLAGQLLEKKRLLDADLLLVLTHGDARDRHLLLGDVPGAVVLCDECRPSHFKSWVTLWVTLL